MRILLWIGNEPNQKALANKLAEKFQVVGIVTESRTSKRKITIAKLLKGLYGKMFLSRIDKAWSGMKEYYQQQYSEYPKVPVIDVENINCSEANEFSKSLKPDLIIVSGTRMIKSKSLSINANVGILNLHTGLSPYIKGGPNCTNWCLATKQYHLIGNTIMWIDEGIDSGNILTTEFTELIWNKSLLDIHIKVMDHAHDLYIKAIVFLLQKGESNVPQLSISKGRTYYSKEWDLKNKINLLRNLRYLKRGDIENEIRGEREKIKTVKITLQETNSTKIN